MIHQKNLQPQMRIEHFDIQMADLEKQIRSRIQKTRDFMLSNQRCDQLQYTAGIMNPTSEMGFPEYEIKVDYKKQFWDMYLKNQIICLMIKEINEQTSYLNNQIKEIQNLEQNYVRASRHRNRKKNRRLAVQIQKKYGCPYEKCQKVYGTDVSLNLHIKLKHNGGNKTDRQKLAQQICEAETNGKPLPKITLNFPPGYIQAYRIYFKNNKRFPDEMYEKQ